VYYYIEFLRDAKNNMIYDYNLTATGPFKYNTDFKDESIKYYESEILPNCE